MSMLRRLSPGRREFRGTSRPRPRTRNTHHLAAMEGLEGRTLLSAAAPGNPKGGGGQAMVADLRANPNEQSARGTPPSIGNGPGANGKEKDSSGESMVSGPIAVATSGPLAVDTSGRADPERGSEVGRPIEAGAA